MTGVAAGGEHVDMFELGPTLPVVPGQMGKPASWDASKPIGNGSSGGPNTRS